MKKVALALVMILVGTNASARTYFEGKTAKGETCSVTVNFESENISFSAKGGGFGFYANETEIITARKNGQNPVVIEGGDGPVAAKLALNIDETGYLLSVVYTERTLFFWPKTIQCNDLQEM